MPNNLQILAYIQCLKNRVNRSIVHYNEHNPNRNSGFNPHRGYLCDIEDLEKYIRGEK